MTRISKRRERHFIDEHGRLFWINGPETHCYLSEQRQWRRGLGFEEVLVWKQCAPSGLVSQRFASLQAALEAFQADAVQWYQDLYLRRMGDQMAAHRSVDDYKPTAMQQDEARGARVQRQPWLLPEPAGPVCGLPPRIADGAGLLEVPHPHRRRRSGCQLAER
ncbi:hypothetical protein [Synechococcus sp. CCAP 1479/9]|uniref:hypothetical protein n=1 Tax=Synechococcus sp. CCAP 1479/9 TaxID=1221593 RepID=UPI001C221641|nr:hypothetical protein [Synechococcus sp. CCAP 1479/9]